MMRMEIKESNCRPCKGGGRSAANNLHVLSEWFTSTELFCQRISPVLSTNGAPIFSEELKSSKLKKLFFRSQQFAFILDLENFFSEQQSFTCVNEILVLPLLKQTILFKVKPRPDSNKITTKKTDIIF